jgi:signal transduction histidine kinase
VTSLRWLLDEPQEEAILDRIQVSTRFEMLTRVFPLVVVATGIISTLLVDDDGDDRINVGLLLLTVLPWIISLGGHLSPSRLTRLVFVSMVLAPTAVLTVAGGLLGWFEPRDVWFSSDYGLVAHFVMFLIIFMLADISLGPRKELVAALCAAWLVSAGRFLVGADPLDLILWMIALAFVTLSVVATRTGAVIIARGQQAIAEQAAADDRRRIARDVHDVVAHSLAVTMLHVTAARMAAQRASADEVVETLEEAERHGRASLADIRRIVRLLRSEDEGSLDAVQPDLSAVDDLVDGFRGAGLPVRLHVTGPTESVGPAAGLAVYRVTQEALANAARHGDGPATVDLRVADRSVALQVRNPTPARASRGYGSGLVGMEERVTAAGGTIEVGAENGTWVVQARVPLDPVEPAPVLGVSMPRTGAGSQADQEAG